MGQVGKKASIIGNTIIGSLLVLVIVMVIWAMCSTQSTNADSDIIITDYTIKNGSFSVDGKTWTDLSEGIPSCTEDVIIRGYLSQDMPEKDNLYLYIDNLSVILKINGEEAANFGEPGTYPKFSRAPGMSVVKVQYEQIKASDEIEFQIHNPYYKRYRPDAIQNQLESLMYSGPDGTLYHMLHRGYWLVAAFGLALIVVAFYSFFNMLIYVRNGYIESHREISTLLSFAFFALVGGLYIVVEALYYIFPLAVSNPVLCNILDGTTIMLLYNAVGIYCKSSLENKYSIRAMYCVCIYTNMATLASYVLQFMGIRDLYETQLLPMIGGIMTIFICVPLMIYEAVALKNKFARYICITCTPLILTSLVALVLMVLRNMGMYFTLTSRLCFAIGITLTAWLQVGQLVSISKLQAIQTTELASAQKELADTRISMMMSQIQPHFLYNALNTIQYQCQVDGESAAKTVESFSKFLRGNMDSLSQTEPIPLKQELQHLENYLAIERLRFPDISYVYKLKAENFNVPPLSIQPLVENSIRYGVRAMEEGGTITIETWEDEHNNYVRVSDNGAGFDVNQKKNDGRSHVGMQNIKSRVNSMCGGHIEIESKIGEGTRSTIVLPKGGKKR